MGDTEGEREWQGIHMWEELMYTHNDVSVFHSARHTSVSMTVPQLFSGSTSRPPSVSLTGR